jgi:hypothetical protein
MNPAARTGRIHERTRPTPEAVFFLAPRGPSIHDPPPPAMRVDDRVHHSCGRRFTSCRHLKDGSAKFLASSPAAAVLDLHEAEQQGQAAK